MAITVEPQSTITLVKCKLEADLKNTFTFSSLSNQTTYFNGLTKKVIGSNNYAYVRKDNMVEVDEPIDSIIQYNYMYYTNTGFSNKRFYCFIDRMEYSNENATKIYFHTDVFQTWYFQLDWNRCFIEREHTNDDSFGSNTVPEGLETGDFVCNAMIDDPLTKVDLTAEEPNYNYIISATCRPEDTYSQDDPLPYYDNNQTVYNGIYSGNTYFRSTTTSAYELSGWLNSYAQNGTSEAITSIFVAPRWLAPKREGKLEVAGSETAVSRGASISINATLDGYTPKNNKMYTGDYNYLVVSNNAGAANVIKWEDWISGPQELGMYEVSGSICPGCSVRWYPMNYKRVTRNNEEGLTLGKYPVCSWKVDSYTNWLTQNSINVGGATLSKDELNMATSVATLATGTALMATGAGSALGAGMMMGGLTGVANNLYAMKQHNAIVPASAGNTNSGDVTFSMSKTCFTFYQMSVRYEYARIIDNFFSAYGYKVNRIKVPNITGRSQWNFVKTVDCNVDGDIPQEDLQTIRTAMDRGVTFWHNPANIYNYSLNNDIV